MEDMFGYEGGEAYVTVEADDSMGLPSLLATGSVKNPNGQTVVVRWKKDGGISGNGWKDKYGGAIVKKPGGKKPDVINRDIKTYLDEMKDQAPNMYEDFFLKFANCITE